HRLPRRPAQLGQVDLVERRQEKHSLHVCAERRESRRECLLEPSVQRQRAGLRRVCAELGRGCGQLDQGEWITGRFLEDPGPEIDRQGRRPKVEKGVRSILVQSGEGQLGQVGVVEGARQSLSDTEQQDCRIRFDPPRHERKHLGGRPVQPLRVIDHEQKRCLSRPFCDEPERREADQEQVRSVALGDTERRLEGLSLRVWKEIQTAE
ncbi:MAG: hypothetical protein M3O76_03065, partial [Actinomycetota bacterium]|nr:hypothetical protein [Actinomycetota bacterium]